MSVGKMYCSLCFPSFCCYPLLVPSRPCRCHASVERHNHKNARVRSHEAVKRKAPINWGRMPAGEPNRDSQLSPISPR